ncbi:MAG: hypothetical protein CMH48_09095 [Muricauda sp.]|nr:hypothetical protein [Allomuricauda sp.]MBC30990.1 hypothetical protein [Allomuricauda sp.]|tara:strand:+ start:109 stop:975 length:867 start_codon:yes stop_codon:yes gene_type:complete
MRNIALVLVVFLMGGAMAFAQFSDYKYIVVPKKFAAFKNENQHATSTLVKYLFDQQGFNVVYEGDFPDDLNRDRCLGLWVRLWDDSNLFVTRTTLAFEDCENNLIFQTAQGRSKLKEYRASYEEAIRGAFASLKGMTHNYVPKEKKEGTDAVTLNFDNDVKSLEKEAAKDLENKSSQVVEQKSTIEEQLYKSKEPVASTMVKKDTAGSNTGKSASKADILYAQPIEKGYQLVDTTPKVRYKLQKTSVPDVYLVVDDDKNGIVFKKDGKWFLQYEDDDQDVMKELNIKF